MYTPWLFSKRIDVRWLGVTYEERTHWALPSYNRVRKVFPQSGLKPIRTRISYLLQIDCILRQMLIDEGCEYHSLVDAHA